MTLTGGVFSKQNATGTNATNAAITYFYIHRTRQVDDKLAPRRSMKIQCVVAAYFSENDALAMPEIGYAAYRALIVQRDIQILKVRGTVISGINT